MQVIRRQGSLLYAYYRAPGNAVERPLPTGMLVDVLSVCQSGAAGVAVLCLCTAIGKWAGQHWGQLRTVHAVQHNISLRRCEGSEYPVWAPRRGTDNKVVSTRRLELGTRPVNEFGEGGAGIIPVLGCNPIRKEPRSLACLSRVGCPDEIRNRGFGSPTLEPHVLWGGRRGRGGLACEDRHGSHGTRAIRWTGEFRLPLMKGALCSCGSSLLAALSRYRSLSSPFRATITPGARWRRHGLANASGKPQSAGFLLNRGGRARCHDHRHLCSPPPLRRQGDSCGKMWTAKTGSIGTGPLRQVSWQVGFPRICCSRSATGCPDAST